MSQLTTDQLVTITEFLSIVIGIAITWAVYYGSERAELPGEATIPDPSIADDMASDTRGRTLG
ncbi:MAG: hypothetical protein L3K19_07750 [Thermoplasmata archaeon]|nr:hypothetical protein [Thermoplasmata archaeon]